MSVRKDGYMNKTIEQLIESLDTIPFFLLVQDYQEDIIIYLIG